MPHPLPHGSRFPARLPGLLAAAFLCQGFFCAERQDPPGMPSASLSDIHLEIRDPAQAAPGVRVAWTFPGEAQATYFEIFQGVDKDSLRLVSRQPAADSPQAHLSLPDSARPFTVYFAVRAVLVEPTGQKIVGDTLPIDSLVLAPSLTILQPGNGSYKTGRSLDMEVQTGSDNGVMLRIAYFEKAGSAWTAKQDTCLPLNACGMPVFGNSVQRESLTLESHAEGDTVDALFCVIGTESFQQAPTGMTQSLGCSRFQRVGGP